MAAPDLTRDIPGLSGGIIGVLPAVRREQRFGRALSAFVGLATLAGAGYLLVVTETPQMIAIPLLCGMGILKLIALLIRRRMQCRVMPIMAGALGLTFETPAHRYGETLPECLLPKGLCTVETRLHGRTASRDVSFAEVQVDRTDTDPDPLFKGIVMEVESALPLPDFVLVQVYLHGLQPVIERQDECLTQLKQARVIRHNDLTYGVYTAKDVTLDDALTSRLRAALVQLPAEVSGTASLFSARFHEGRLIVAIKTTARLFAIGNLMASQDRVAETVQHALQQMSIPMSLLGKVLEAEAEMAQEKRRGEAPAPVLLP